jgi:hypothetical protein
MRTNFLAAFLASFLALFLSGWAAADTSTESSVQTSVSASVSSDEEASEENDGSESMVCETRTTTGSRLGKRKCTTRAQAQADREAAEDFNRQHGQVLGTTGQ